MVYSEPELITWHGFLFRKIVELGKVKQRSEAVRLIKNIRFDRGQTMTHLAIRMLREEVFNEKGNDRADVPNMVIFMTDGNSHNKPETFKEVGLTNYFQELQNLFSWVGM